MEINDLIIFQSVAYNGSISKVAEDLNYVQSHATSRIKLLEQELQTELFHRHSRGTTLNSEGEILLAYTDNILSTINEMTEVMQDSDNPSGKLKIGTIETVVKLPWILSTYSQHYPNVDLSLTTDVTDQLIEDTLNHKLDGAFVTKFDEQPNIIQHQVFQEELVLISNEKNSSLRDLVKKPLLVFKSGCSYRQRLEKWIQDKGIPSAKILEFGTLETILGNVISGLGISFVPKSTIKDMEAKGMVQSYRLPSKYSEISTVFIQRANSYSTKAIEKFIETINLSYQHTDPEDFNPIQPIFESS